ncbi:hypothetical protein ACQY0O_004834 [Thecaphora frezii]
MVNKILTQTEVEYEVFIANKPTHGRLAGLRPDLKNPLAASDLALLELAPRTQLGWKQLEWEKQLLQQWGDLFRSKQSLSEKKFKKALNKALEKVGKENEPLDQLNKLRFERVWTLDKQSNPYARRQDVSLQNREHKIPSELGLERKYSLAMQHLTMIARGVAYTPQQDAQVQKIYTDAIQSLRSDIDTIKALMRTLFSNIPLADPNPNIQFNPRETYKTLIAMQIDRELFEQLLMWKHEYATSVLKAARLQQPHPMQKEINQLTKRLFVLNPNRRRLLTIQSMPTDPSAEASTSQQRRLGRASTIPPMSPRRASLPPSEIQEVDVRDLWLRHSSHPWSGSPDWFKQSHQGQASKRLQGIKEVDEEWILGLHGSDAGYEEGYPASQQAGYGEGSSHAGYEEGYPASQQAGYGEGSSHAGYEEGYPASQQAGYGEGSSHVGYERYPASQQAGYGEGSSHVGYERYPASQQAGYRQGSPEWPPEATQEPMLNRQTARRAHGGDLGYDALRLRQPSTRLAEAEMSGSQPSLGRSEMTSRRRPSQGTQRRQTETEEE